MCLGSACFLGRTRCRCTSVLAKLRKASLRLIRRSGHLVLTFHPHCSGGGAKDDGRHWAQTRAASLCLSQGFDLKTTTAYVDAISSKGSANRILQALQAKSEDARWTQLSDYAKELDIAIPQPTAWSPELRPVPADSIPNASPARHPYLRLRRSLSARASLSTRMAQLPKY